MGVLRVISYAGALIGAFGLLLAFAMPGAPQQAAAAAMAACFAIIPYCISATAHRAAILKALRKSEETAEG